MEYYESVGTDAKHRSCLLASGYWVFDPLIAMWHDPSAEN